MSSKIKYQIFVSSTYEDLKDERAQVIKAILEMGHIPVGMEMFSAADEEQWKQIQRQIDDCDYYVVIVAHRYGSIYKKVSYTEREYDYASEKGIPTLGLVINDNTDWPITKSDTESDKKKKLDNFKNKIKKKLVSFWTNKEDLYGKASIALMKQFNTTPREGWIKANQITSPEVANELSRLSKENSDLREKIAQLQQQNALEKSNRYDAVIDAMMNSKVRIQFFYEYGFEWESLEEFMLLDLFALIAPQIMVEYSTLDSAYLIGLNLNPNKKKEIRGSYPIPQNTMNEIFANLQALNLVEPSKKKHSVHDKNKHEYWSITEEGKNIYNILYKRVNNLDFDNITNSKVDNPENESTL